MILGGEKSERTRIACGYACDSSQAAAASRWRGISLRLRRKPKASPGQPVAIAPAPVPVTTQKVMTRDLQIERTGLGTVMPLNTVDVKARVDGYLQRIAFTDG